MKSFLISNSKDTWVGLRLAGINGVIVRDKNNAILEFRKAIKDEKIGILILNENVADMIGDELIEFKLKSKTPLILEIPDRRGSIRKGDAIANYIRESVGIRI
ncbi:MAG: V-type ATP synthase subunit F [Sedimentibacter sp.]|uniref:V-type ATP synthase subunit F n=1 Tax=Sedimentibacter sp. TaxID=1960295 RepID=UPI0029817CCE|nr:V-type ATP synthase subunit F [Sedimentibacter sp.]MDW5300268.1 V-type ATP synthase subunit F [Sedimentibacter sp.]